MVKALAYKILSQHCWHWGAPGRREVLIMLAQYGALASMITAGARILESGCGPCRGQGQVATTAEQARDTLTRGIFL